MVCRLILWHLTDRLHFWQAQANPAEATLRAIDQPDSSSVISRSSHANFLTIFESSIQTVFTMATARAVTIATARAAPRTTTIFLHITCVHPHTHPLSNPAMPLVIRYEIACFF
jgi:hypothetical protein